MIRLSRGEGVGLLEETWVMVGEVAKQQQPVSMELFHMIVSVEIGEG